MNKSFLLCIIKKNQFSAGQYHLCSPFISFYYYYLSIFLVIFHQLAFYFEPMHVQLEWRLHFSVQKFEIGSLRRFLPI